MNKRSTHNDNRKKAAITTSAAPRAKKQHKNADSIAALKKELEEKVTLLSAANRQLKRKIFDLYTIFEISRNFNAVLNYQNLLDSFIFTCLGQVGALKGVIYLKPDGQGDRFYPVKSKGSGGLPSREQHIDTDSPLAKYLSKLNRPCPVSELMRDLPMSKEQSVLKFFEFGVVVPLIYQTRLIGVLALADKISGKEFGDDDLEFLSILGNQIAVAIENARLYESEKAATKQLRAAQQQLLHTEKLAALGEMSAKVAHEVNNPLGIVKNYMLLIKQSTEKRTESEDYVEIVSQELNRIAEIVKQLLEFHRPQTIRHKQIDLVKILNDMLVLMERQLSSNNIELTRDFPLDHLFVLGSPENLKQVFLNLVINARDAMPKGGRLAVSVETNASDVIIQFVDTGPGIPTELIPRIFEPFFTTKEEGKGTGLGLSVCYGIIKSHSGSITFKNIDRGGCFEIRLPLSKDRGNDEHGA
jgi:two-component system sensor histidine kinase HydH